MSGTYQGERYSVQQFGIGPTLGYYVQREGGGRHECRPSPASCTCGDFVFRRDGLTPVPCRHVRALRHILDEHGIEWRPKNLSVEWR